MTPIEAHKYADRKKINILSGPGYIQGKREKSFDGFGWHDGLLRTFRGPKDYRDYLKANNLVEASVNDKPIETRYKRPIWNDELIQKAFDLGILSGCDGELVKALKSGKLDYPDGTVRDDLDVY